MVDKGEKKIKKNSMSPKKWKCSYDSSRKYKNEWEKNMLWVKEASDGTGEAYCKLCRCNIMPKLCSLQNHEKSEKHQKRKNSISNTVPINFTPTSALDDVKRTELELATAICCHCSKVAVDHLGEVIKRNGSASTLAKIKIHRTKCSKILTEVVSPAYNIMEELSEDVSGQKFAILVDESTDISTKKLLCIIYYYQIFQ